MDVLSYQDSIRLRLLIMAVLIEACPPGMLAGPKRALASSDPLSGWIRQLGRLMSVIQTSLDQSVPPEPVDDECLEAMGLFRFAAGISLDAAIADGAGPTVITSLEKKSTAAWPVQRPRKSGEIGVRQIIWKPASTLSPPGISIWRRHIAERPCPEVELCQSQIYSDRLWQADTLQTA